MSFLSEIWKGSSNKASRVAKQLQSEIQKIKSQNTVIQDEGLIDIGATAKGRIVVEHGKLVYTRKITVIPTFKVPVEPDGKFLTFWIKSNHTGLHLRDSSKFDNSINVNDDIETTINQNIVTVNNSRHLCLVDA